MTHPVGLPAKRVAQIKAALKKNKGNVLATASELSAGWKTVDKIRKKMGLPTNVGGLRTDPKIVAAVKADLEADNNFPTSALAAKHKVGKASVINIRVAMGLPPHTSHGAGGTPAAPLDASPESRQRVADAKEISRLKAELKKAHETALDNEAMRTIIGNMAAYVPNPPKWLLDVPARGKGGTPEVPIGTFADWHYSEVVPLSETGGVNEYNPTIAKARVQRLVSAILHLCKNHGPGVYPGMVLNLAGDFLSGALHPELAKTDAMEQLPATLEVFDLLIWAIDTLVAEFGFLYIPCTAGNHGRNTMKPEFKRYAYKNFDWFIYQLLAKHYENDKRIQVDVPDANEVHYRVWDKRFLLMHGDMLGVAGGDGIIGSLGPIARGEVKVSKQSSAIGKDIDMMIIGHYHQELWLPRVTVANCLVGFNEYGMKKLRAVPSAPSQPLFFMHPTRGITSRWNVLVEEPKKRGTEPWVSFEKRAA